MEKAARWGSTLGVNSEAAAAWTKRTAQVFHTKVNREDADCKLTADRARETRRGWIRFQFTVEIMTNNITGCWGVVEERNKMQSLQRDIVSSQFSLGFLTKPVILRRQSGGRTRRSQHVGGRVIISDQVSKI